MPGTYAEFALCGLNCGLCPRYHTNGPSRCPGCRGPRFAEVHPTCPIIRCSERHDNVEYCHECSSYPCDRYQETPPTDSFITYVPRLADQRRAQQFGMDAYRRQLDEKIGILKHLLAKYDDGRRKGFYCLAVNLLDLELLRDVVERVEVTIAQSDMDRKECVQLMVSTLNEIARERNISLRLRGK
ncbi:MAG: DUF3795 domain-containing protein [Sphaerochaeta sp.]|nr:DUF3795 domain-containing protein [Sphaerochaeta sp.]